MKTSNISRWGGTILLFAILYFLYTLVLIHIFTGSFSFDFGYIIMYIPDAIKYFFVPDSGGTLGQTLGLGVLVGLVVLFIFSYWIMGEVFRNRNTQRSSF